jgi:hypothetical protein
MVHILLKPGLLPFEQPEPATCRAGVMLLQSFSPCGIALAFALNRLPCIDRAIRVDRQIDDAEIYPQHALHADAVWLQHITDDGQVERASDVHQIDLAFAKAQHGALPYATLIGDGLTTSGRPQREVGIGLHAKDAVIIRLRRIPLEASPRFAVQFVGIRDFRNTAHGHLCRQTKLRTTPFIRQLVQGKLPKRLGVPGFFGQPGTGTIGCLQGCKQSRMLCGSRKQFEIGDKFHGFKYRIYQYGRQDKGLAVLGQLSFPLLSEGSSLHERLL